ncbi:MAG TPA: redoxin domain-containing protein, partial [Patescibacteria group bacterium]|nr:redoxin domain-containing protein [Patescibacteria group bacterium]
TGSQITLTYKPEKTAVSSDRVRAFVYTFTEMRSVPKGDEVLLSYDATLKAFKGVYSLEKDVVFGLLKIATPTEMDNNKENFWDFLVHDASGKPLRGAQMRAGISYLGNLPTQAKRNVDISRGLNYIQNESTAYPDNIQAQIGALSLRFENKQIEKAAFDEQLGKIVNTPFDKTRENDLRAVTRALKIMNENDRAAQLENEFMVKFPKSELAEEIAVGKLSAAKSEQEFATAAQSFISTFPASVYTERVFTALLNIYLQQGKVDEAKAVLSRLNSVPASAYNQIAFTISEKGLELADALAWNDRALKDAEMPNLERKPIFVTPSEWAEAGQQTTGAILFTRGAILNKMGQSAQALETFTKAKAALGENTPVELYSALVSVHESTGNHREAYEVASEAIRLSKSNNEIAARHKALYASLHPKAKDYDKVLSGFSADASKSRRAKVASEKMMMVSPLPNETMSTFDGRQVSLNDLKGKIVILDFWATWCGPCRQSFPAMQKLYEKYKSNPNVVFAIVNVWEREKDRKKVAKDYLDKNPNFTFPVYFDEDDAIVKSFGVTGIPTKFYLDKNGLVQFKEVGFAGEEGFLRDAEDKIEVLLKEG